MNLPTLGGRRWRACSTPRTCPTRRKRASRGCSEAQDVAQQHPCASFAVEDDRREPHHLPAVQGRQAGARRVPHVRHVQGPPVRRGAALRARRLRRVAPAAPATGLLEKLGVQLDPELLVLSLTHRSFAHENGGIPTNERLEFLGDTVLGLVVTETLYRRHPDHSEGELAKMRAATVSQKSLAVIARTLGLGRYVLLGKGEIRTRGNDKDSILSDTVESVIGAVYLSHGLEEARALVLRLVEPRLTAAADLGAGLDWKTSLQEAAASAGTGAPVYTSDAVGPDHAREFTSYVHLDGRLYGTGRGTAKKYAEQEAAERAYQALVAERAGDDAGA
ncbi:ribonuclease III [Cellulosimicrobium arenosum]|uniref:Ribonuclease 3 n=1 Tax=Cellulosimicrobium arenosum TaxID=2708133 RepID=A0A927J2E8_9MICO|nr:ribonuclease III [Cellulosimicrobium arenosum]